VSIFLERFEMGAVVSDVVLKGVQKAQVVVNDRGRFEKLRDRIQLSTP
jgi:hypothetical protein